MRPTVVHGGLSQSTAIVNHDADEFSEAYDYSAPPVGLDMSGHDRFLMGAKVVMLDGFIVDLLNVDTSAQTFRLKLLVNLDWEDDGTIEPEVRAKRNLGRTGTGILSRRKSIESSGSNVSDDSSTVRRGLTRDPSARSDSSVYKTGKYVLKQPFVEDPLATTWNPEMVLVNAISDEDPIEAGSKLHSVQMLAGRPVISRTVLYQPECRCEFTFSNFPFDETDLVVKLSSNKWNADQVQFLWSHRLNSMGRDTLGRRVSHFAGAGTGSLTREASYLDRSVDKSAIGGVGLSEFEIIKVRVETDEKDVNSMQRYDNAEGAFSQAHLIIRVRRDPYSYLLRVASVAELLMFLEFLSFMADNDLSDRFSISGTIFLAMVSLYGPMADALPKVSVVTRVDKWHLSNFVLLFASNVENLLAFALRGVINERLLHYAECLLGILYLHFVVRNMLWFVRPLKDRDEYIHLVDWFEDKIDSCKERIRRIIPGMNSRGGKEGEPTKRRNSWEATATTLQAAVRLKKNANLPGKDNKAPRRSLLTSFWRRSDDDLTAEGPPSPGRRPGVVFSASTEEKERNGATAKED
ncbi:hypothetical protein ACHAXT_003698 [Thalassiosira profunda]